MDNSENELGCNNVTPSSNQVQSEYEKILLTYFNFVAEHALCSMYHFPYREVCLRLALCSKGLTIDTLSLTSMVLTGGLSGHTVFCRAHSQKMNPYPYLMLTKLTVRSHEYLNFKN